MKGLRESGEAVKCEVVKERLVVGDGRCRKEFECGTPRIGVRTPLNLRTPGGAVRASYGDFAF